MAAINRTSDAARYPGTVAMTDAVMEAKVAAIPKAIRSSWNARPYKLKITDSKCGERLYGVNFNPNFTTSSQHYTIDFVNVPGAVMTPDYKSIASSRAYVLPSSYTVKFNLDGLNSITKTSGFKSTEPHEYGHMIGLKDEYNDQKMDRNGCIYEFFDGTLQKVSASDELMSNARKITAQPERYCLTIAYAVVAIFAQNGIRVTALEIL